MQKRNIWAGQGIVYIISVLSLLTVLSVIAVRTSTTHTNFALHFNKYALISFASALVDVVAIILMLLKKRYNQTINWFLLFVFGATIMAIAEGLQRASVHQAAALFWQNMSFAGLSLLPPAFYLFIVSYTNVSKGKMELLSAFSLFTWGIVAFIAGDGYVYLLGHQVQHTAWGYISNGGKLFLVVQAWLNIFYILGSGLLFYYRKNTRNAIIKKQLGLFIIAFLLPFIVALNTNLILPGILKHPVLPLATAFGAISAVMVFYGISRYRLFDIDPQIIAQNILDTMSEGVIIVRQDKTIETLNSEASRLLGITLKGDESVPLEPFFTSGDWKVISPELDPASVAVKDRVLNKSLVLSKSGVQVPVRVAVTSLIDNNQKMASILVLTDISEIIASYDALSKSAQHIYEQNEQLTRLESQLREEKANVEHTVEVRTKELVRAQERLKIADQLKTEFIMLTSHNLRTPLAIAEGYADIAFENETDEKKLEYIKGMKEGLSRLSQLVESLITINYIEAGNEIKLEEVPIDEVLEPLLKETEDLAATKNDQFVTSLNAGEVKIKADVARLQAALRSLLSNACKFTQDGKVELTTNRSGDNVIISISDNGIGIDPKEIDRLFTKFHKGTDVEVSDYEGQGIGLYLAKLIIDEHKGNITAVSALGKGSTFTIELPCF